jgi:hypothetical protein
MMPQNAQMQMGKRYLAAIRGIVHLIPGGGLTIHPGFDGSMRGFPGARWIDWGL